MTRHWDDIFASKVDDDLSWFEEEPATSLRLVQQWSLKQGSLIDVGAGRSCLVDRLLDAGWRDLCILDLSEVALGEVRRRLAARVAAVTFICRDVRTWRPGRTFATWHDRAVFHFLVEPDDRDRYVETAASVLPSGGVLVVATFAEDGPSLCSGLPTNRYDADDLAGAFEPSFTLVHAERQEHTTPFAAIQPFTWVVLRRS